MVASIDDYCASVCISQMVKAPQLRGGVPAMKNGRLVRYSGGFCVVFPFIVGVKKYALRCWHTEVKGIGERMSILSNALKLPYFLPFEYVPNAIMTSCGPQPAMIMDWTNAVPLKRYIEDNLDRPLVLEALGDSLLQMVKDLHRVSFSHGDLQHCNILVRHDGSLVLVDYDSMYVPGLECYPDTVKGLPGFQHPARANQRFLSPESDYFSELVIYTTIRALARHPGLWKKLNMAESETLILSDADIKSQGRAQIFYFLESDRELRPLCRALVDALHQNSLDRLSPLEFCLEGPEDTLADSIAAKWNATISCDYPSLAAAIAKAW